ncbi:MAG: sigma-70 family RNA polymerase sigma factor [Pseudomonadales bacterium]|nr:sigma-70 family RNA polymerase sigma factor [Pseudomonadales bacterium]
MTDFCEHIRRKPAKANLEHLRAARSQDQPVSCEARYFSSLAEHNLLSAAEEKQLALSAQNGDIDARNRMVEANLRLVVKVAKPYANGTVPMLDLISEGNLGLIHAIAKFRPEKGFRFSTYAIWWIRERIQSAVMRQSNIVYMPLHAVKAQRRCLRAQNELRAQHGQEPTISDIANASSKSRSEVETLLASVERISPIDRDDSAQARPLAEQLADENNIDPAARLACDDARSELLRNVTQLNATQQYIVIKRYGLHGETVATLQALSEELGMCRQTVKKLHDKALARLLQLMR